MVELFEFRDALPSDPRGSFPDYAYISTPEQHLGAGRVKVVSDEQDQQRN